MMYHHSWSSRAFAALVFCISHILPLIHFDAASAHTRTNVETDLIHAAEANHYAILRVFGFQHVVVASGNDNDNADVNDQNQSTAPPPTPLPTLRNTPNPSKRATNVSTDGLPTLPPQPSSTAATPPTPASIVSSAEQNGNGLKNEIDASTSNEDNGNYNPSNLAWFDKAGWDRDAGTNEALVMRRTSCVLLGLAAIIHLFMMLD
eukprot:scaffold12212_cov73-Skeletonema_dohrnii-CCMP3373.AAC.2